MSHKVTESQSHEVTESQSYEVTESQSHEVTESQSHEVTETQSHEVAETQSHEVTESQSHEVTETQSHEVTELRDLEGVSGEELFNRLKVELMEEIRKYFEPLVKSSQVGSGSETAVLHAVPAPELPEEDDLIVKLLEETGWRNG